MDDDPNPRPKPLSRDAQRAEALRANLIRRKAQARDRAESAEPLPLKSPGEP
jgi:hypothetical protein